MKSNILRVGNYVNEFGIIKKATPLLILKLHQIEQANKVCLDITSINLTEDLLIELGFKKSLYKKYWGQEFYKKGISIYLEDGEFRFYSYSNRAWTIYEYVHEIQTLYYILTGKEVEFKRAVDFCG